MGDSFFQGDDRERIGAAVVENDFSISGFDNIEIAAMSAMRTTMFPKFCEHQLFARLMAVKAGQPRAIMLEKEMAPPEAPKLRSARSTLRGAVKSLSLKKTKPKVSSPVTAKNIPDEATTDKVVATEASDDRQPTLVVEPLVTPPASPNCGSGNAAESAPTSATELKVGAIPGEAPI